ncbi:MAG: transcription elongation factor GreA [Myxococcota bacterium]|jgi:transcription elongation factor GreA|nr:transcription elongation factor GreA [Myxococcota bacterium]MEC9441761.1 transcription elongation factor GreA [Myxococcota bacterium]
MATKYPMTVEGNKKLKEELDHLKKVERPAIVKEIEVARAHGDLRENAEYHAAKEKQGMIEARISHLDIKLSNAEVIDVASLSGDRVLFGAHVTIFDLDTDDEVTYQIVGDEESDIKQSKISYLSPIAKALIGREVGEEVAIETPKGKRNIEIMDVEFKS